ncbi:VTT domain-containing protein [Myxococcota bacterium]|nr:VTT domain-containing protein [Myxococcota bacterium]MBU1383195.1 VTT domain-containing protein [Myxococcota bacterium]MBU1496429.1 VTT domain-containing protein [Myxococcota bacterium]
MSDSDSRLTKFQILKALFGTVTVPGLILLGWYFRYPLRELLQDNPLLFIVSAFSAICLFLPRITILISAGLLFHPLVGALLTVISDLLAGAFLFFLGKTSFGQLVLHFSRGRLETIRNDWMIERAVPLFAMLRIMPLAHYAGVSVLAGSARVPFFKYILGTFFGLIPTALIYPFAARAGISGNKYLIAIAGTVLIIFIGTSLYITRRHPGGEAREK